jgi:putative aldouronate transport system substrate-binding protein
MKKVLMVLVLCCAAVSLAFAGGKSQSAGAGGGEVNATGLPIVTPGSYSFTLFVDDIKQDDNLVMFPILEQQTGIKVQLVKNPYTIAQEKLAIALNSGDYADCIGGWTLSANMILQYGVQEGVFIPLEDLFEKYTTNIKAALKRPGVREAMTAPDGHIYSIPYVLEAPLVAYQPWINTRWLKNVGLPMPKTTAEFEAVLKAFKEKDANGNGNANDEIPFSGDPNNLHLGELAGWFGMSVASARDANEGLTMVNGKLTFGANSDQYKAAIKYLASLNAQGLLDPELFTQDKEQWKAKGAQDRYGVIVTYFSQDIVPLLPGQTPEWEALPVLTSSSSVKPVFLRDNYGSDVLNTQVVITDKAKNPAAIVRWWDNVYAYENTLQTQHGPLGVTLFKNGNTYTKIDVSTLSSADQTKYDGGNLWPQALPKYDPDGGYRVTEAVPMYDEMGPADTLYEPYLTDAIPAFWVTEDKASTLSDMQTSIGSYVRQKRAQWISGQANIDTEWNAYLDQLKRLRVDEYVTLRQSLINSK